MFNFFLFLESSSASQIQPFVAIKEISVLEDQPGLLEDSELHDARVLINPNCEKIYFVTNSPRYSRDERCGNFLKYFLKKFLKNLKN